MKKPSLIRCVYLVCIAAPHPCPAADRPNIVFLLTDDQRADTLGCYGNPIVETPNIDSLATRGVRFANAFVTTSICMTSRASIMLGQYAARHGVNVVSSTEELLVPEFQHAKIAHEIDRAAREGRITVLGTGVNPGFAMDFIASVASAVTFDVRGVKCVSDLSRNDERLAHG